MSRTKSALKAQRSSARKQVRNTIQATNLDKLVRGFKRAETPTQEQVSLLQKAIDKAAKTGLIHKGKASRMKSRFFSKKVDVAAAKPTKKATNRNRKTSSKAKTKKSK